MTKQMTLAVLAVLSVLAALAGTGCALETPDDADEELSTTEEALTSFLSSPKNYYYTSGGVTWFQDDFSTKWCTGATAQARVYDYNTTCSWTGWWDNSYRQYCDGHGAFWQSSYYHFHCP